jgi:uncharacterized protein (DUF849 family)
VQDAIERGYNTRVGLEDMLHLPDGTPAPHNAALVMTAAHMITTYAVRNILNPLRGVCAVIRHFAQKFTRTF